MNEITMYIYRVLDNETNLYDIGVIIAEDIEKAKEYVCKEFDKNTHTITVFSKENICDLFASDILNNKCINFNDLCFRYGYKTKKEMELQNKLNAIQPLINTLSLFSEK